MKRNFGSLNLTALDMSRPLSTSADCSLEDRFSAMGPSVDDCTPNAGAEDTSEDSVGYPLEHLHVAAADRRSESAAPDVDMEETLCGPIEAVVSQARRDDGSGCLQQGQCPTSPEMPPQLPHDNVELNALRRLSLKVMLSNLSTSSSSSSNCSSSGTSGGPIANVASTKPKCASYPGVNGRAKTALLPIRHPSLQSV
ncbi:unnamed protein product [Hyaloperonospora brassicae]|uniref:RxLR effector candidate protein n=1 Tax=Hyaloperonospora brassicae TaxID=162125 RepID=A0AAV0TU88_HYABA|nr:unnamed protein product [Hyaloperonospora brassicae]